MGTRETLDDFIRSFGRSEFDKLEDTEKSAIKLHYKSRKSSGSAISTSTSKPSFIENALESQRVQTSGYDPNEISLISDIANGKGIIEKLEGQIILQLQQEAALHNKINEGIGIHGELSKDFRSEMIQAYPAVLRLGYGMDQLGDFIKSSMDLSGRFNIINSDTMESVAGTSRAFVGDIRLMGENLNKFMNIGLGAKDASEAIDKAGINSLQLGLNSKKTTEILMANLAKINEYGFKNGTEGLARMVQKSIEFRMNIEESFKIADKVWSPEGAIDLAAYLQVIGGAIGAFNDPLRLMYMATNDVEGLQDALINAASGLATYNEEQGRFEVTGVNLRRAKAMADSLGVSVSELTKGAIASSERLQINSQMMAKGFDISEKDREFITNMSQMRDGKMVIEVPDDIREKLGVKEKMFDVTNATDQQIKVLLNYRNDLVTNYKTTEAISRGQLNVLENLNRDVSFIAATMRTEASSIIRTQLESMGYDQRSVSAAIGTFTDLVGKGLVDITKNGIGTFIKGITDKGSELYANLVMTKSDKSSVTSELKKSSESQSQKTESKTETNSNVNIRIAADGYFDIFAREIQRQPEIWKEHLSTNKNHYTNSGRQ